MTERKCFSFSGIRLKDGRIITADREMQKMYDLYFKQIFRKIEEGLFHTLQKTTDEYGGEV